MCKRKSDEFIKIQKIINDLNDILDKTIKLHEKGEVEGDVIDEVTELIRHSYKEQLRILGYKS